MQASGPIWAVTALDPDMNAARPAAALAYVQEATMLSAGARRMEEFFRTAPKMIAMQRLRQCVAGEHAENLTLDPTGVSYAEAPAVKGLWANPADVEIGSAVLYLFGGGYVPSPPHARRKFAGHIGIGAHARILIPGYRLAPEHPFPAAIEDATAA